MPLSLVLSPPSSPADALRAALIDSLHAAHRPELADLVASADLALDFPGVWLRPVAGDLDSAWLERTLLAASVANGLPLEWVRVLPARWGGAGKCFPRKFGGCRRMRQPAWWCRACGAVSVIALGWCRPCYDRRRHSRRFFGGFRETVLTRDRCCQVCLPSADSWCTIAGQGPSARRARSRSAGAVTSGCIGAGSCRATTRTSSSASGGSSTAASPAQLRLLLGSSP